MASQTIREAVGVFNVEGPLQAAADELMISGFDRSSLSIIASQRRIEAKLGHMYDRVSEIEDDPDIPRLAYIGRDTRTIAKGLAVSGPAYLGAIVVIGMLVSSGSTLATVIGGALAAAAAGALIGVGLARLIDRHHVNYMQAHLDRGGLLLWVRTDDEEQEKRASEILVRFSAEDVHVHEFPSTEFKEEYLTGGVSYELSFMNRLGM